MKSVQELISGLSIIYKKGNLSQLIKGIVFDSREVKKGELFVALKGTQSDGHQYINKAIENGATAVVCQDLPENISEKVTWVQTKDSAESLGLLCANFHDNPSKKLKVVGVTGTNGKTTTATLLYKLFKKLGYKVGLISTVVYYVDDLALEATHTTPDPVQIQSLMARMVEKGCSYCFMEVSSHALVQKRTAGIDFNGAVFTNITQDHLDFHVTFDQYIKAKKMFFDNLNSQAFALVNNDDRNGKVMIQNTKGTVSNYALHSMADFKAKIIESHFDGMLISIDGTELWVNLIGEFNVYNLLAIYSTALLLGENKIETLQHLSSLHEVDGRFQQVRNNKGITVIVDYAHTPDALANVLRTIREIRNEAPGQIITVAGAGGNRDKTKRPIMAKICAEMSDKVILTSDNPRFEEPQDILNDMLTGISHEQLNTVLTISDRREAIKTAIMLSKKGDIVLVAGKGHETYQEIKGIKHHFDDREELDRILNV